MKKSHGSIGKYIQNPMLNCNSFCALGKYWGIQDIKSNVMYRIAIEKSFRNHIRNDNGKSYAL